MTKIAKTAKTAKAPARKASAKANPDIITTAVNVRGGQGGVLVEAGNGQSVVLADWQINAETTKLAAKGGSYKALMAAVAKIAKPDSKLAKGVDSRNSPNSAKAVRDLKAANKGSTAGEPGSKQPKAAKKAKAKSSGRGYDAALKMTTLVKPKDSKLAEGSGRMAKLVFAAKCKTVGDFLGHVVTDASGKEHKCDAGALSGLLKREHVRLG